MAYSWKLFWNYLHRNVGVIQVGDCRHTGEGVSLLVIVYVSHQSSTQGCMKQRY
jgi:hypothetical protein